MSALAWVLHILLVTTFVRHLEGTAFGVTEEIIMRPLLEGTIAVPLDIQMPVHLMMMLRQSMMVINTINSQMSYLNELEYDIFCKRSNALNLTLAHLNNTLIEEIYHPIENRPKRALLDIGGKLLQGIFGVATETDVKRVEEQLGDSVKNLWTSQNKIVIVTNILKKSFMKLSEAIIDQNKLLQKFNKKNEFKWRLMNTMSLVGESINLIHVLINEYENLILRLRKGFLPNNVVTDQMLRKIIKEGINKFVGTKFPGNDKGSLSEMVRSITVHHTENPFKFILYVPFVSDNDFKIYNIVAVPIVGKNNELFIASEISGFIGINEYFYFFSKNKINCKEFYCETELHLRKRSTKSCALELVTVGTGLNCLVEKFETTQNYYIEKLQSFWVVVFFDTTSFVISCGTEKTFRKSKGLFKVPLVCTLETETFILTSAAISNSKVEIKKKLFNYKLLELNNTIINSNISDQDLKSLDNMKKRLTNIKLNTKKEMDDLKSENMKFRKNTYIHIGANYSSLVLFILPIVAVIIFKKRHNKKQKELEMKLKNIELRDIVKNKNGTI